MVSGPRRVTELLRRRGSPLDTLVREAAAQARLDRALGEFLDRPLRDHVQVAGARDGVLVLAARSPVWGHRVRYLAPAILERLRRADPRLADVRIVVRPPHTPAPASASAADRRARLPRGAASVLRTVAASCDNPALARALERLARRAR